MVCTVQPAIQGQIRNQKTQEWDNVDLPVLVNVPVQFPSGGGFTATFPLAEGDEVLVMFADRCIDGWWQSGGIQAQIELRSHDLSDGFAIPKVWSQPNVLSGVSATTMQLRSDDGLLYVELAGGHVCNIVAPGGLNITAPNVTINASTKVTMTTPLVEMSGDLRVDGEVTGSYGGGSSVGLETHTHAQDPDSDGDNEQETNAPTPGT